MSKKKSRRFLFQSAGVAVFVAVAVMIAAGVSADGVITPKIQPLFREAPTLDARTGTPVQLNAVQRVDSSGNRTLTYNGAFPGPEIHVDPGAQLQTQIVNFLEHLTVTDLENFQPKVVGDNDSQAVKDFISAQSAITNFHTHGFHVSPRGRADNVLLKINQGRQNTYTYDLPPNHAPGTHWYHAHLHGSTALQVQGGMAGALIVDAPPGQSLDPPGYAVSERVLVMQFGDGGSINPDADIVLESMPVMLTDDHQELIDIDSEGGLRNLVNQLDEDGMRELLASLRDLRMELPPLRVNGLENPVAEIQQDVEVQRLRIINAGSKRQDYKSLWIEGHDMYLAAFDGVNLTSLPRNADGSYVAYNEANPLVLAPGNRADVYFLPTDAGAFSLMMEGEIGVRASKMAGAMEAASGVEEVERQTFVRSLMTFDVAGPDLAMEAGFAEVGIELQAFLDALNANLEYLQTTEPYQTYLRPFASTPTIQRNMTFDIANSGTQDRSFRINGRDYNRMENGHHMGGMNDYLGKVDGDGGLGPNNETPWPLRAGTEEQWKIVNNSTVQHPFHIHVSPFWVVDIEEDVDGQIVSVRATNPNDPRLNRWQDTIDLPPNGGSVTIQHRVSEYVGVFVVHCHILQHEDRGMMINIMTVPNDDDDPQAFFEMIQQENEDINQQING